MSLTDTKEKIIMATLELASAEGLGSVSMSGIAEKVGIRKASLYSHFASKEEIISEMYRFLRDKAKQRQSPGDIDYGEFVRGRTAEQALSEAAGSYVRMCNEPDMLAFYRVIYSQRAVDAAAAGIMAEETARMITATKNLFYALSAHGKLFADDIDAAALSFAMAVHSIIDYRLDCQCAGISVPDDMLGDYIRWFSKQYGGNKQ